MPRCSRRALTAAAAAALMLSWGQATAAIVQQREAQAGRNAESVDRDRKPALLTAPPLLAAAPTTAGAADAFEVRQFPQATLIYCPATGVRVEFWPAFGRFHVAGPGAHVLEWAYAQLRSSNRTYVFPTGLRLISTNVGGGVDHFGPFKELAALWQASDRTETQVRTAARIYATFPGIVFEQSFPTGVKNTVGGSFASVGCAFPVFDPPSQLPPGTRWLSYTYQDWPIPIRGEGWPGLLPPAVWPAAGADDSIRTPLVFFNSLGSCDVLSPVDHAIQQIAVLSKTAEGGLWTHKETTDRGTLLALKQDIPGPAGALSTEKSRADSQVPERGGKPGSTGGEPAFRPVGIAYVAPDASRQPPGADGEKADAAAAQPRVPDSPAPGPRPSDSVKPAPTSAGEAKPVLPASPAPHRAIGPGSRHEPPGAADSSVRPIPGVVPPPKAVPLVGATAPPARQVPSAEPVGIPHLELLSPPVEPGRWEDAVLVGTEGKIEELPPGAALHSVLTFGSGGVANSIMAWGAFLQRYNGKLARKAPDDLTDHVLGYWTDNGSAYYYHTEGNASYQAMLAAVRAYHVENHIPVRYYQLDSWWYSKGRDGGTSLWSPNVSVLPEGSVGITRILGAPLALHNRYWSAQNAYLDRDNFVSGKENTVPLKEAVYDRLFRTVSGWGCRLYEQDWLAPQVRRSGVLQSEFGAPGEWLSAMDEAASHYDLPIQFCMPSIGFYLASTRMPNVTQIRTSRDFDRANPDSVHLRWMEHTQLSLLAAALGLAPSKDVLLTTPATGGMHARSWETTEAILAILSRGPVGIGDAFGHTDPALVARLCQEDGTLVQPDRPAVPVEATVTSDADAAALPTVMQTESTVGGKSWFYLAAVDLGDTRRLGESKWLKPAALIRQQPATTLAARPLSGPYVAYDYEQDRILGEVLPGRPVCFGQDTPEPGYAVLAPLSTNGLALIGDVSKFVTVSNLRFKSLKFTPHGLDIQLQGPPASDELLAVYDRAGPPTLVVGGLPGPIRALEQDDPLYEFSAFAATPGAARSLWHFHFHLPANHGSAPVHAIITAASPARDPASNP